MPIHVNALGSEISVQYDMDMPCALPPAQSRAIFIGFKTTLLFSSELQITKYHSVVCNWVMLQVYLAKQPAMAGNSRRLSCHHYFC